MLQASLHTLSAALLLHLAPVARALPQGGPVVSASGPQSTDSSKILSDPNFGPIPAESPYYSGYNSTDPPFPGNYTQPVFATESGPPGPDDLLFQNLLGAEWAIYGSWH